VTRLSRFGSFAAAYTVVATTGFALAAVRWGLAGYEVSQAADVIALAILVIVAEQLAVEFGDGLTVTASNLPSLLAIMYLDPAAAMLTAGIAGGWGFWREDSAATVLFNTSNYMVPTLLGALTFQGLHHALGFSLTAVSAGLLLSGAAAAFVYQLATVAALGVAVKLKYGRSAMSFWRSELAPFVQSFVIVASLGLAVAALYAKAGVMAVVLILLPLFAAQYMFKLLVREREHVQRQTELSDQYLEMNIGLAAAMVVLLDSKDEYTADHSAAVAMYCRDMAQAVGMSEQEVEEIHVAGLLHDLGKVGTPDAILGKIETLSADEWQHIHRHPETGAEVLSNLATYKNVADIVRYHHERLDGSGYPEGLRGEGIPEASKILAVADSYHAMTSDRPYRPARSSFEALKELRLAAGVSLDSRYVEALAQVLRDKTLAYRDGSSTDFMDEFRRGRSNLRLREELQVSLSPLAPAREDPAATQPERKQ